LAIVSSIVLDVHHGPFWPHSPKRRSRAGILDIASHQLSSAASDGSSVVLLVIYTVHPHQPNRISSHCCLLASRELLPRSSRHLPYGLLYTVQKVDCMKSSTMLARDVQLHMSNAVFGVCEFAESMLA
jgi:hypothetical protein